MKKRAFFGLLLTVALVVAFVTPAAAQGQAISTNKDKLLTLAVQGRVAPAQPSTGYSPSWDGKLEMRIGIGGINYDLKIGDKVFGPAAADRATVGVATEAVGVGDFAGAYLNFTAIGNEVRILNGEGKGEKGVIVAKFNNNVLMHFDDQTLEKLAIGDKIQVKARGTGLAIDGFDDVLAINVTPEILEQSVSRTADGKLEVSVVKEIHAEIVGQGAGRSSLSSVYHIQT